METLEPRGYPIGVSDYLQALADERRLLIENETIAEKITRIFSETNAKFQKWREEKKQSRKKIEYDFDDSPKDDKYKDQSYDYDIDPNEDPCD